MELALGTVQFGLAYGVAGAGVPVPSSEVRAILARARALGIRWLDTAAAYGDIEERLSGLMGDPDAFSVVSKISAVPTDLPGDAAAQWVGHQLARSRRRLGPSLKAVLFHRAQDLLDPQGDRLWQAAQAFATGSDLQLGVSCYDPDTLTTIAARYPVALAQLPGNALDQRLCQREPGTRAAAAIHVRSAFLQGLLLMPQEQACERLPAARTALQRWHGWCAERGVSPLVAALGIVKALPGATHCVVGVDSQAQLESIAAAWLAAPALTANELACSDPAVIDPRQWHLASQVSA